MVVKAEVISPFVASGYVRQLTDLGFTHVVTIYLPGATNDSRWLSEQYETMILEAYERWQPDVVLSTEINFDYFPTARDKLQDKLRSIKPIGLLDLATSSFTHLYKFMQETGVSDKKFYLLYRAEFGQLYDDRAREAGFKNLVPITVDTLADLRTTLSSLPKSDDVAIINAVTYVRDVEFNRPVLAQQVASIIARTGVLDVSVIDYAPGAITVLHTDPSIRLESGEATMGKPLIHVKPKRLDKLGLKQVYLVGFGRLDGITQ